MYTEEKGGFPIKDLLVKILFLTVFVLLLMWLFPISRNVVNVKPLTDKIYSENIKDMKDAAKAYYTNDKLPKNIGEKVGMSLQSLIDRKLIIAFADSKGNSCDTQNSYVEITKVKDGEYLLKSYLACGNQRDYVNETLGCCDKCNQVVDNNKPSTPTTPTKPQPQPTGKTKHAVTHTEYKYIKTAKKEVLSAPTAWSFTKPTVTSTMRELQERMVYKYITGYSGQWVTEYEFMLGYNRKVSSLMEAKLVCSGGVWTVSVTDICKQGNCVYNNGSCPNANETYSDPHIEYGTCGSKVGSSCPTNGATDTCTNTWEATCSSVNPNVKTWSDSTSLNGWVATGNSRDSYDRVARISDWVEVIPAGYDKYTEHKQYRYKTVTGTTTVITATTWSDYTSLSGWTKTQETRTVTSYVYY